MAPREPPVVITSAGPPSRQSRRSPGRRSRPCRPTSRSCCSRTARAMPKRCTGWCRWSTRTCGGSPGSSCGGAVSTTRSTPAAWSTRCTCGWSISRGRRGGTAATSWRSRRSRCGRSPWITSVVALRLKRGGVDGAVPLESHHAAREDWERILAVDLALQKLEPTTPGWPESSSAATSPGCRKTRRRQRSACRCAPRSASGSRHGPGCAPSSAEVLRERPAALAAGRRA